jgi:hypothetical protein
MARWPSSHGGERGGVKSFGSVMVHKASCILGSTARRHRREEVCGSHQWSKGGPGGKDVGEEMRDAVTTGSEQRKTRKQGVTGVLGFRGSGSSSQAAPGFAAGSAPSGGLRSSSPLPLLILRRVVVWTADESPKAARVGSPWMRRRRLLIGEARRGARGRTRCSGCPRSALRQRHGDDDGDVMLTSA